MIDCVTGQVAVAGSVGGSMFDLQPVGCLSRDPREKIDHATRNWSLLDRRGTKRLTLFISMWVSYCFFSFFFFFSVLRAKLVPLEQSYAVNILRIPSDVMIIKFQVCSFDT